MSEKKRVGEAIKGVVTTMMDKVLNNVLIFHRAHQQQGAATAAFGDNGRFLSCSGEFTETAARDTDAGDD